MSARDGGRVAVLASGHAELDGVVYSTTSLRDSWSATVPVDELSDVVSTTEDLPVTWPARPEGLAW
ncbi:hypothetical protein OMK64_09285 [Cellulomonas fimi]|uniref:hypothetical protein n=1 Tax=Cellulomonas fimi TaxID=1708 RepID=UPI00234C0E84|nr:hypothetical protein [Cellulomonas fimi]MDC7121729.1 hypothetical protein [Cellulomonas fimi]